MSGKTLGITQIDAGPTGADPSGKAGRDLPRALTRRAATPAEASPISRVAHRGPSLLASWQCIGGPGKATFADSPDLG